MSVKYELKDLKRLLKRKGWSYRRLGAVIGMSADALCNKLNGRSDFDVQEITALCNIAHIEAGEVVKYFMPWMEAER